MDLLGSIMSSMDKPPTKTEKEKNLIKKRKEELQKRENQKKEHLKKFKEDVENKMKNHFNNPEHAYMKFLPMDQLFRSIIHEVAEAQGYVSFAFGEDGVDRYVRVYRKDTPPSEDELAARRQGDPWNLQIQQQIDENRQKQKVQEEHDSKRKREKFVPNSNYKDKYAHLIGQDAALDAAKKTETNKQYGFVPSENKKDIRSIEQTMADIRAKKRQKISQEETTQD